MASFPCPREQVAASALLLLSTTTPRSVYHAVFDLDCNHEDPIEEEASKIRSCRGSSAFSDSRLIAASENSDFSADVTSPPTTFVPGRSVMKLKVVRKARSKIHKSSGGWRLSSGGWRLSSGENTMTSSETASTDCSCLTTGCSSEYSSAQSRDYVSRAKEYREEQQKRKHIGSNLIRQRAEGILNLLSDGCYSEVAIRQLLGDSPDTSKALRILLKLEQVKRSGIGGRLDPYIYMRA